MAVSAAIGLGQLDSFVDYRAIRHFWATLELVRSHQQNGNLNRAELLEAAVEPGLDELLKFSGIRQHALKQLAEVFPVGSLKLSAFPKLRFDIFRRATCQAPLIKPLQGQLAGDPALRLTASSVNGSTPRIAWCLSG